MLPLLWNEFLNLCRAGSEYILLRSDDGLAKKIANTTEAMRQDQVAKANYNPHWRTIVVRTFKYKFPF